VESARVLQRWSHERHAAWRWACEGLRGFWLKHVPARRTCEHPCSRRAPSQRRGEQHAVHADASDADAQLRDAEVGGMAISPVAATAGTQGYAAGPTLSAGCPRTRTAREFPLGGGGSPVRHTERTHAAGRRARATWSGRVCAHRTPAPGLLYLARLIAAPQRLLKLSSGSNGQLSCCKICTLTLYQRPLYFQYYNYYHESWR